MAWVTPKTNWTENDYFNLEDAERITGDLKYLKERTLELFPDTSISLLLYRETTAGYNWYVNMPINISNLTIYDYQRGSTAFAEYESHNWYACLVLSALWIEYSLNNYTFDWFSSDGTNKAAIDYYIYGTPRYWYTGYGVLINDDYAYTEPNAAWYLNYLCNHYYWGRIPSNYPFELEFMNNSGSMYSQRNPFAYPLENKPFWMSWDLNSIERTIANTYRLINEMGG